MPHRQPAAVDGIICGSSERESDRAEKSHVRNSSERKGEQMKLIAAKYAAKRLTNENKRYLCPESFHTHHRAGAAHCESWPAHRHRCFYCTARRRRRRWWWRLSSTLFRSRSFIKQTLPLCEIECLAVLILQRGIIYQRGHSPHTRAICMMGEVPCSHRPLLNKGHCICSF